MKKLFILLTITSLPAFALSTKDLSTCTMSPEVQNQFIAHASNFSNYIHNDIDEEFAGFFEEKMMKTTEAIAKKSSSCSEYIFNSSSYMKSVSDKVEAIKSAKNDLWNTL